MKYSGFFDIIQINNIQMEAYRFDMKYSEAIAWPGFYKSIKVYLVLYLYLPSE